MQQWHSLQTTTALSKLSTQKSGLSSSEVEKRLLDHGPNTLPESEETSLLRIFVDQFSSPLIIILLFAAAFAFVLHEFIDAVVITTIVLINSVVGFWQEYNAEKTIESLKHMSAQYALVIRDGERIQVNTKDLVPGDILSITAGDKVGADLLLLEAHQLSVNESLLTGESKPVIKNPDQLPPKTPLADRTNMLFSGTIVESGRGLAVVVNTGISTELGKIASLVHQEKKSATPLQKRLARLAKLLGKVSLAVIVPIALLSLWRQNTLFEIFELSVSLAVSTVPEGLPVVVTIALAIGIKRMFLNKALIRRLPVVEVLGNTDVICTDKTGTLTTNQMTFTELHTSFGLFALSDGEVSFSTAKQWENKLNTTSPLTSQSKKFFSNCVTGTILCSDATANTGDPTEIGIIQVAAEAGFDIQGIRSKDTRIDEIPFSSEYKYMTTLHESHTLWAKGSTEAILHMCNTVAESPSNTAKLTAHKRQIIQEMQDKLASRGSRILALAHKKTQKKSLDQKDLHDLTFLGLIVLEDPVRPEAQTAIHRCASAGIAVKMITGDHLMTAQAVAKKVGIATDSVCTGTQLDKLTDEELRNRVEETTVFARVTSEHKLRILKALQTNGHITAMGGDGVNDAPALKKADIGFSVGSGTDLAKEVADMILLDDNFATIPKAIRQGRVIFQNIRNFLKLMLSTNFDELLIICLSILFNIPLMYIPIHILWINLLSDGLPASALAFDKESDDVMSYEPNTSEKALFKDLWPFVIVAGLVAFVTDIIVFSSFYPWWSEAATEAQLALGRTSILVSTVVTELILVFICRTKGFAFNPRVLTNRYLIGAVLLSFTLLICTLYIPLLNTAFETIPLTAQHWITILIPTVLSVTAVEIFKRIYYKNRYF